MIVFTYFYTAIVMNVQEMADNLKKYGNYIPGIRPGKPTYDYLDRVISRITLAGAVFLAGIAVTQYIVPSITGFTSVTLVGGTSPAHHRGRGYRNHAGHRSAVVDAQLRGLHQDKG